MEITKKTILNVIVYLNILVVSACVGYVLFVSANPIMIAGICLSLIFISAYFNDIFLKVSKKNFIAGAATFLLFNVFILTCPFVVHVNGGQSAYTSTSERSKNEKKRINDDTCMAADTGTGLNKNEQN